MPASYDDRKTAAIKGWQTRHARQRMLKDAQDFANSNTNNASPAQDYATASQAQNKFIAEQAQRFANNLSPAAQREYANSCNVTLQEAERVYQQNEQPEAHKKRLAKLKAWWRWFYHGE